jgi:hypothetical protein
MIFSKKEIREIKRELKLMQADIRELLADKHFREELEAEEERERREREKEEERKKVERFLDGYEELLSEEEEKLKKQLPNDVEWRIGKDKRGKPIAFFKLLDTMVTFGLDERYVVKSSSPYQGYTKVGNYDNWEDAKRKMQELVYLMRE